jgi:hypothetical protein
MIKIIGRWSRSSNVNEHYEACAVLDYPDELTIKWPIDNDVKVLGKHLDESDEEDDEYFD